jgi:hypothetical protein
LNSLSSRQRTLLGLVKKNDPRNDTNEHENVVSDISWIVFNSLNASWKAGEENQIGLTLNELTSEATKRRGR